jgi:hypothetical protein
MPTLTGYKVVDADGRGRSGNTYAAGQTLHDTTGRRPHASRYGYHFCPLPQACYAYDDVTPTSRFLRVSTASDNVDYTVVDVAAVCVATDQLTVEAELTAAEWQQLLVDGEGTTTRLRLASHRGHTLTVLQHVSNGRVVVGDAVAGVDAPSLVRTHADGRVETQWLRGGLPHSDDGTHLAAITVGADGATTTSWYRDGVLQSPAGGGPAVVCDEPLRGVTVQTWYADGQRHRDGDLAAEIRTSAAAVVETHYRRGVVHRDAPLAAEVGTCCATGRRLLERHVVDGRMHADGRAAHRVWDAATGTLVREAWYQHGELDRADGPALQTYDVASGTRHVAWYRRDELHRDADEPALTIDGPDATLRDYFRHGRRHRDGGRPARIRTTRSCEYYVHGLPQYGSGKRRRDDLAGDREGDRGDEGATKRPRLESGSQGDPSRRLHKGVVVDRATVARFDDDDDNRCDERPEAVGREGGAAGHDSAQSGD